MELRGALRRRRATSEVCYHHTTICISSDVGSGATASGPRSWLISPGPRRRSRLGQAARRGPPVKGGLSPGRALAVEALVCGCRLRLRRVYGGDAAGVVPAAGQTVGVVQTPQPCAGGEQARVRAGARRPSQGDAGCKPGPQTGGSKTNRCQSRTFGFIGVPAEKTLRHGDVEVLPSPGREAAAARLAFPPLQRRRWSAERGARRLQQRRLALADSADTLTPVRPRLYRLRHS